jgi:putative addiction module component (TIGR02574 family)
MSVDQLTKEALALSPNERVVLAETLLLTIDETHDSTVNEMIIVELERRLQDFRDGKVTGIPVADALRKARETLARPS